MDAKSTLGVAEQIKKLKELLDAGAINEQEFDDRKIALLNPEKEEKYILACSLSESESSEDLEKSLDIFNSLENYKDSNSFLSGLSKKIQIVKSDEIYNEALVKQKKDTVSDLNNAVELFSSISEWKDSNEKIAICKNRIEEIELAEKNRAKEIKITQLNRNKKIKKLVTIIVSSIAFIAVIAIIVTQLVIPLSNYNKGIKLMNSNNYGEAVICFREANGLKDTDEKIEECKPYNYQKALDLYNSGDIFGSLGLFEKSNGYQNSDSYLISHNANTISAGGYHTVGLKSDGTVVATKITDNRYNYSQCDISGWTDIVAISAGIFHTVGLKSDGTVVAVGYNSDGQCNVSGWTDIVAISAGYDYTVGLKSDGTVVAVGKNHYGQCNVQNWTDIVAISAGSFHTVGLKFDGTVVATNITDKDYDKGQCDVSGWTDIVAISASGGHTVGLKSDGTVVAVGENHDGQCNVQNCTDIVAISAGDYHTVGLKSDGTVVAVGYNSDGQCNVSGWTDIVAISAGSFHTVGLKSNGTVVATKITDKFYDKDQCDVSGWNNLKQPLQ